MGVKANIECLILKVHLQKCVFIDLPIVRNVLKLDLSATNPLETKM